MLKNGVFLLTLGCLMALNPDSTTLASSDSLRGTFVKDRPAVIDLAKDGIRADSYRFDRVVRGGSNPLKMNAGPTVIFSVKNEGTTEKEFGIAVALFDTSGRLVAAGGAGRGGKLDPGKSEEVKVVFHGVNREAARAATIYMTMETRQ
ncbi:MAG TPA: hypothetical protein VFE84_07930 [Patescibacteria group bacterium]|nr:hypothetical protein [Patescibacteria group bacterium]